MIWMRAMRHVTSITFDAAGTLLRPHPSVGAIYREVALAHGCDLPEHALDDAFRTAFHHVSKDSSVLDPEARERDFWRKVVRHAFASVGREPDNFAAFFAGLWETFAHGDRWRVFEGTTGTLRVLRQRGYRLGILSNWDSRLHRVLDETGLRDSFHAVTISSEAGAEKPDTGIFRAAEAALGASADGCLHIGDSHRHDIDGARAAGWSVLRVRHDDEPCGPGEIARLGDLLELLPGITAAV